MSAMLGSTLVLLAMFVLLGTGIWVAIALLGVSVIGMLLFTDAPIEAVMPTVVWSSLESWTLAALPLFIWMGEILCRTRLAADMFHGLAPWMNRLPGGLLHVNVVGCGLFAAVCGSSAATCATVGPMSLPELSKRGYDERMSLGSLAASGTLGLLIPPSIMMIIYGVSANVSISRLFLAGIVPGLLIIVLFMGYIAVWALLNRSTVPVKEADLSYRERLRRLRLLIPVLALIGAVMGSIYSGIATATEAAALGVLGALVIAGVSGGLSFASFRESLLAATRTSCMIAFIIAAAAFLSTVMAYAGIPKALASYIESLELSRYVLILALAVLYLFLGTVLEGASMIVLTAAFVLPMVQQAGIDMIWFGIFIVIMVEIAQLSPPVGFNLFVVQALTSRTTAYVMWSVLPFFGLMLLALVILTVFPELVLWLPSTMM